jgi:hypothetical protein
VGEETEETPPESEPASRGGPALRFEIPDVRGDLAALPGYFRTRRLLWLGVALLVAGLVAGLALGSGVLSVGTATGAIALYLYQSTLFPPAIIPIFIAGFAVPRGSYLAGLVFGLASAVLYLLSILAFPIAAPIGAAEIGSLLVISVVSGAVIGGFAAWYRDFLQRSAVRRRAAQAERQKQRRREERRGTRSPASPR